MTRIITLTFFSLGSILSFGQKIVRTPPPTELKDTVYIGILNAVKLEGSFVNPLSAESVNGPVQINRNELILRPVRQGKLDVLIKYKDTIIKRTFVSTYLPKPTE